MSLKFTLIDNISDVLEFKASLIDGVWYGNRSGKKYIVNIPKDICNKLKYYFSSETNDYYPIGTPRTHDKLNQKDYIDYGWFVPFKKGIVIKGVLNAANHIDVNWKLQHTISKREYERASAKRIAKQQDGSRGTNVVPES